MNFDTEIDWTLDIGLFCHDNRHSRRRSHDQKPVGYNAGLSQNSVPSPLTNMKHCGTIHSDFKESDSK